MFTIRNGLLTACALISIATVTPANAKTVYVATNGNNHRGCGAAADPCRTIGIGIKRAAAGDTVEVGPGLYGDINNDYQYTSKGDEPAPLGLCDCVVEVNKPLTVRSRNGASQTTIFLRRTPQHYSSDPSYVVQITANDVHFGEKDHGFTIVSSSASDDFDPRPIGVVLEPNTANAVVAGNVLTSNRTGIAMEGSNHMITANVITGNATAMHASGTNCTIKANAIEANGTGMWSENASHLIVSQNTVTGHAGFGLHFENGTGHMAVGNAIVGNGAGGVYVGWDAAVAITGNDIYGNGGYDHTNCGLENNTNGMFGAIMATGNYWGAGAGPGSDPADKICNSQPSSKTLYSPIASFEIGTNFQPTK